MVEGKDSEDSLSVIDALISSQRAEGKLLKMLKTMEQSLILRKDMLGADHPDVQNLGAKLTHEYNGIAMQILRADEMHGACHSLLKKAYLMTDADTFFKDTEVRLRFSFAHVPTTAYRTCGFEGM